jgi:hypothetical protein
MADGVADSPPRSRARITGVIYFLYFLTAICGQLLINRGLAGYGLGISLFGTASYAVLTLLFYWLFKPVNRNVSLIAAFISLAGCIITALGQLHFATGHISPLAFFGPYCLLIGYLILRSAFLPRVLGALMMLAGLGWLIALRMPDQSHLLPYIDGLGILAEGLLMLWLLVLGVNEKRWQAQQASAAAETHS